MTLRFLAGASYLDLCIIFGVHKSSFYRIFWETMLAIDEYLNPLTLEDDVQSIQKCRKLAAGFAERTDNNILGCIGALDGISLEIEQPRGAANPLKYFCRKLFNAVSVQAICDSEARFTFMSFRCAGSTHDSFAWAVARLRDGVTRIGGWLGLSELLRCGCPTYAPYGFFISADDAYSCCPTIVTPWPGARRPALRHVPCTLRRASHARQLRR